MFSSRPFISPLLSFGYKIWRRGWDPKSRKRAAEFNDVLEKHRMLFSAQGSGIKGFKGSLKLKEGAKSVFMKVRPVPYLFVEKVEKEYDRLVESDILYPVSSSNWASPAVLVP